MSRLRNVSGEQTIKILCRYFGFSLVSQKGSHVKLVKMSESEKVVTIVPLHRELKLGTIKAVLKLAKVNEGEFERYL